MPVGSDAAMEAAINDKSDQWFDKVVDRLLAEARHEQIRGPSCAVQAFQFRGNSREVRMIEIGLLDRRSKSRDDRACFEQGSRDVNP